MIDDDRLVFGVELGGTKCIAMAARGRSILAIERFPTAAPEPTLAALHRQLSAWLGPFGKPVAIGVASFGPLVLDREDPAFGRVSATPKPGWSGVDLLGPLRSFGVPIGFDTDVAGAALSEHRWGAARDCDVAIYLTIGTGVGGALLVNGSPVHGRVHPEMGHIRIRRVADDGFAGVCRFHGDCLEGLVAGPALAARTGLPGDAIPDDHPVWDRVASELAEAMAMLIVTLSPNRIVIGGGVTGKRKALLPAVRQRTAALLAGYVAGLDAPTLAGIIVPPALGDEAGPLGAAVLAYRVSASR